MPQFTARRVAGAPASRRATGSPRRLRTNSAPIHAHPAGPPRSRHTVAPVRATSPPPALTVAAAVISFIAAVLLPLAVASAAPAERWLRPVPGEVARSFSYSRAAPFARGAHRGADLAARSGTPVRSACAGTVVHAGPVADQGQVVSVRCGDRRVSYLPLARVAVRAGAVIRAGASIGTVAAGHRGLHFGVRREADRFGYEDPLRMLAPPARPRAPTPVAVPHRPPRPAPVAVPHRPPRPAPVAVPHRPPRPAPVAVPHRPPRPAPRSVRRVPAPLRPAPADRIAPWPVWAGLALLLAGATGSGTVVVRRRRDREATAGAAVTRAAA